MSPQQAFAALQRLSPEQALAYLRDRGQITQTWSWADLRADEHAHQFTISRLASVDLLQQLRDLIVQSVDGQLSRTDFLRDAKAALASKGWWGEVTTTDPATGREVQTTFNPSRLKMIYDVNVRQAHAVAQWQRIEDSRESHPYLRYITKDDARVREQHRAWHHLTLPVGHPFWRAHFPPNGYRCRCRVTQVSHRDYDKGTTPTGERMRKVAPPLEDRTWLNPRTGESQRVPLGIDPGFANNPGMARAQALRQLVQEKIAALDGPLAQAAQSIGLQGGLFANRGAVTTLTGSELGEHTSTKDLRKAAMAYAQDHLVGETYTNADSGHVIKVTRQGVKHSLAGANEVEIKLLPALPQMLANAKHMATEPDKLGRAHILAANKYETKVSIGNETFKVWIVTRQNAAGHEHYDTFVIRQK